MRTNLPRVLIVSHDVVGQRMAGPGIRAWEIARVLAQRHVVELVAPAPIDLPPAGFALGSYAWGSYNALAPYVARADVIVANGFVLRAHPELATCAQPLALDMYDPVAFERIELLRTAPEAERHAAFAEDSALLQRQLAVGDFFLCATERQRDLYLGAMLAQQRIRVTMTDADPQLRSLIDVAPFGLPAEPPTSVGPALRGVVPGILSTDRIIFWTGGLWDWLDPVTLIDAMPHVLQRHPDARLVFPAGRHPGNVPLMRAPQLARARAAQLGLLDRAIFFYEAWIPYARRADFLLEADIAVSLHLRHLETTYAAVRSRFLDHLWAALPSVVSEGDAAAELVASRGLGRVVPIADSAAVAAAISGLLDDADERRACGQRARLIGDTFVWDRLIGPLEEFCMNPTRTSEREPVTGVRAISEDFHAELAPLHAHWRVEPQPLTSSLPLIGPLKQASSALTRWYVDPVVDQQNVFNAAAVNAAQALADSIRDVHRRIAEIEQRLADLDDAQTEIARRLVQPATRDADS